MTLVLVERSFDTPVALENIQAIEDAGAWCLEAHAVRFVKTFFSADRRRMLCLYEAPDAESVRLAQRQAGVPFERAWSCVAFCPGAGEGPPTAAATRVSVIVERRFGTPVRTGDVRQMVSSGAWCFDQHGIRYLESYLAQDGLHMVCLFEAPDMESVRIANRTVRFPVHQLWAATMHVPPADTGAAGA